MAPPSKASCATRRSWARRLHQIGHDRRPMATAEALREGLCQQPAVPGLLPGRWHPATSAHRVRCMAERQGPVPRHQHLQREDERHRRTDLLGKGP
eukprot:3801224-Heterocapsa_arctica.AAC.1